MTSTMPAADTIRELCIAYAAYGADGVMMSVVEHIDKIDLLFECGITQRRIRCHCRR